MHPMSAATSSACGCATAASAATTADMTQSLNMIRWHGERAEAATITLDNLVIAGWTGRDRKAIDHHIEELAALGIAGPTAIPCFYRAAVDNLTTATDLQFLGQDSSGEVE